MRRFPAPIDLIMRGFGTIRTLLCSLVMALGFSAALVAAELPTDSERLVIETKTGQVSFSVELALTPADRATGLMNRTSMARNHGMLFRFDRVRPVMMWMKNTPLSLDMLFIDTSGAVVKIAKDTTPFSEAIISSQVPVRYVLELNAGTSLQAGISVGDIVRHRVIGE